MSFLKLDTSSDSLRRLVVFVAVGAFNAGVGYAIFCAFILAGSSLFLAVSACYVLSCVLNFITTGTLVFSNRDPSRFVRYAITYVTVGTMNWAALRGLEALGVDPLTGQLICLPPFALFGYTLQRYFVFINVSADKISN